MNFSVIKETRNLAIISWPDNSMSIDACQGLIDDGYRPIFAELMNGEMQIMCEKVDIYGARGLQ